MSELSDLTIKVAPRDQTGRQACNKLRASGRIPAVLYGKEINKSVSLEDRSMRILLRKASGTSSLLRLLGEKGEDELVLIKDMQMHPIKNSIMHIDFVQVNRGEDLQTKIPLTLSGEAEGVKTEGGILEVLANEVEIRCRPSNLPSQIEIDISNLALGENLQIKDLTGAGDLFASGFLHGLINNKSTKESLETGSEMSSKVIQIIGARLN